MNEPTITITGRLTAPPETRYDPPKYPGDTTEHLAIYYTLAVTPTYFDKTTKEWTEKETQYYPCVDRKTPEQTLKYLTKGSHVTIEGTLTQRIQKSAEGYELRTCLVAVQNTLIPLKQLNYTLNKMP